MHRRERFVRPIAQHLARHFQLAIRNVERNSGDQRRHLASLERAARHAFDRSQWSWIDIHDDTPATAREETVAIERDGDLRPHPHQYRQQRLLQEFEWWRSHGVGATFYHQP